MVIRNYIRNQEEEAQAAGADEPLALARPASVAAWSQKSGAASSDPTQPPFGGFTFPQVASAT